MRRPLRARRRGVSAGRLRPALISLIPSHVASAALAPKGRKAPTTSCRNVGEITSTSATPKSPMIGASTSAPAAAPSSDERQAARQPAGPEAARL
jgi:hypothetical protein